MTSRATELSVSVNLEHRDGASRTVVRLAGEADVTARQLGPADRILQLSGVDQVIPVHAGAEEAGAQLRLATPHGPGSAARPARPPPWTALNASKWTVTPLLPSCPYKLFLRESRHGALRVYQAVSAPLVLMLMPRSLMVKWCMAGSWLLALVLKAAVPPGQAVFVGDTVWDVRASQKAGLPCIRLATRRRPLGPAARGRGRRREGSIVFSSGVLGLLVIGLVIGTLCACTVAGRITQAQDRRVRQEWDDLVSVHWQLDLELDEIWQRR